MREVIRIFYRILIEILYLHAMKYFNEQGKHHTKLNHKTSTISHILQMEQNYRSDQFLITFHNFSFWFFCFFLFIVNEHVINVYLLLQMYNRNLINKLFYYTLLHMTGLSDCLSDWWIEQMSVWLTACECIIRLQ